MYRLDSYVYSNYVYQSTNYFMKLANKLSVISVMTLFTFDEVSKIDPELEGGNKLGTFIELLRIFVVVGCGNIQYILYPIIFM